MAIPSTSDHSKNVVGQGKDAKSWKKKSIEIDHENQFLGKCFSVAIKDLDNR